MGGEGGRKLIGGERCIIKFEGKGVGGIGGMHMD